MAGARNIGHDVCEMDQLLKWSLTINNAQLQQVRSFHPMSEGLETTNYQKGDGKIQNRPEIMI